MTMRFESRCTPPTGETRSRRRTRPRAPRARRTSRTPACRTSRGRGGNVAHRHRARTEALARRLHLRVDDGVEAPPLRRERGRERAPDVRLVLVLAEVPEERVAERERGRVARGDVVRERLAADCLERRGDRRERRRACAGCCPEARARSTEASAWSCQSRRPARISQRIVPTAKTSARRSTGVQSACSGEA